MSNFSIKMKNSTMAKNKNAEKLKDKKIKWT